MNTKNIFDTDNFDFISVLKTISKIVFVLEIIGGFIWAIVDTLEEITDISYELEFGTIFFWIIIISILSFIKFAFNIVLLNFFDDVSIISSKTILINKKIENLYDSINNNEKKEE